MSIWIRLGSLLPVTELAAHSAPTWETLADGGNGEASFDLAISPKVSHPLLRKGVLCEIMCGAGRLHMGRIEDYDRSAGQVVVRGINTDAYKIPALDGSGNPTRDSLTALTTALAPPWNWLATNPRSVSGAAFGDSTSPQMIGDLYDELAAQQGKRWGQDPNGALYLEADPTTPMWLATPDAAAFGSTSEGLPTYLVGTYNNGTTTVTTVRGQAGALVARSEFRDLTNRGVLTLAQANAILDSELIVQPVSWTNGVTLNREQFTTSGGTPACLASVRARTMMRAHGLTVDARVQAPWLDVVIGKTRYTAGDDTIYIEPVNTAPRTFTDVIAAT